MKSILNGKQTNGKHDYVVDMQELPAGIYFIKIELEGNVSVLKLVKTKRN